MPEQTLKLIAWLAFPITKNFCWSGGETLRSHEPSCSFKRAGSLVTFIYDRCAEAFEQDMLGVQQPSFCHLYAGNLWIQNKIVIAQQRSFKGADRIAKQYQQRRKL